MTVTDDYGVDLTEYVSITISGTNDTPIIDSLTDVDASLLLHLDASLHPISADGLTWSDTSGHGNDGSVSDSPGYGISPDATFSYYEFDGVNDFVTTPITRGELGNSFSLTARYRFDGNVADGYQAIFGSSDGGNTEFFVGKNSGSSHIAVQDGNVVLFDVPNAFDGDWHSISYVYDQGVGAIYLDGLLIGSESFSQSNAEEILLIGNELQHGGFLWTGAISSVMVHDRALSSSEILSYIAGTTSDVVGSVSEDGHLVDGTDELGTHIASGTLTAHDLDFSDSLQWSIVDGGSGTYGSFEVDSTSGAWQFTLDNSSVTQALTEDQQVTESFVVRVTDSQGVFDDQSLLLP